MPARDRTAPRAAVLCALAPLRLRVTVRHRGAVECGWTRVCGPAARAATRHPRTPRARRGARPRGATADPAVRERRRRTDDARHGPRTARLGERAAPASARRRGRAHTRDIIIFLAVCPTAARRRWRVPRGRARTRSRTADHTGPRAMERGASPRHAAPIPCMRTIHAHVGIPTHLSAGAPQAKNILLEHR